MINEKKMMKNYLVTVIWLLIGAMKFCPEGAFAQSNRPQLTKTLVVDGGRFYDFNKNGKLDAYEDYRNQVDKRAEDLLSQMTLAEKLAQLQCPWINKTKLCTRTSFDSIGAMKAFPNGLGAILRLSDGKSFLSRKGTPHAGDMVKLANQTQNFFIENTRLGIPVLFIEEALHGLMVKDATMFPSSLGMSCSWNEQLTSEVFSAVAEEARAVGTHILLAPVLDLAMDPRWGRTEETMGEDPCLTSRLGLAKVNALQGNASIPDSNHVASFLKHLGAHGAPEGGNNIGPEFVTERQLREAYFKPFETAITKGHASGVMPNYNEIDGVPAHSNRWLLQSILGREWGFGGIVISDYNATLELATIHHVAKDTLDAGVLALKAGVDLELTDNFTYEKLPLALEQGKVSENEINNAVLHILRMKFQLGLFDRPFVAENKTEILGSPEHRELALEAARQSIVLLKNENNLLPLDKSKYKKIAVIGPNADKCILGGYSHMPRVTVSPLEALKEKYSHVDVAYAPGCQLNVGKNKRGPSVLASHEDNLKLISNAVLVAKDADVIVLMLGGNNDISREATMPGYPGDLADLELLGDQNELVDSLNMLGKPIVAFVFSGPPISFVHLAKTVPAIAQCWYLGQETGYAVAETLFGDNNPSGKLTVSIARSASQLPAYYYKKPSSRVRPYNLAENGPLYPFGFGLSYTSFHYDNLALSKSVIKSGQSASVSVDITNTGNRDGAEIAQMYIRDEVSSVTRPVKELKDFRKIDLKSGETKRVSFRIVPEMLSFYNQEMKKVVEPGEFKIMVGPSSESVDTVKLLVE
ncbi:MAG TPA: glycoside hydrolase family 3 N-terminal domain-containing protein [Sunxiuqinia sp.]|nr:glycoside hydrolase family 3 N-terminal domain-containing protein [Sunxiuqinia sp.]